MSVVKLWKDLDEIISLGQNQTQNSAIQNIDIYGEGGLRASFISCTCQPVSSMFDLQTRQRDGKIGMNVHLRRPSQRHGSSMVDSLAVVWAVHYRECHVS